MQDSQQFSPDSDDQPTNKISNTGSSGLDSGTSQPGGKGQSSYKSYDHLEAPPPKEKSFSAYDRLESPPPKEKSFSAYDRLESTPPKENSFAVYDHLAPPSESPYADLGVIKEVDLTSFAYQIASGMVGHTETP